jgi:hypothetical protein
VEDDDDEQRDKVFVDSESQPDDHAMQHDSELQHRDGDKLRDTSALLMVS